MTDLKVVSNNVDQEVEIQEVINEMIDDTICRPFWGATSRCVGNIEIDGRLFSVCVTVTSDEDDFGYDEDIPTVAPNFLKSGKGVIKAPENYLPSSKPWKG